MSKLSQMLSDRLKEVGKSERQLASENRWTQQAFNSWKNGGIVPRKGLHPALAAFLGIPVTEVAKLCADAAAQRPTKLPKLDLPLGHIADRKTGKWKFPLVGGRRFPLGKYTIKIDTKVMEPAFHFGTKAIVDPEKKPVIGDEVMAHSNGLAWIGVLKAIDGRKSVLSQYGSSEFVTVDDTHCIHVITHSSRRR